MSAKRPQSVRKASAIVRNRSQSFAEGRTCRRVHRVQNLRETQNCRHFLRFALQKCQQSQGSGGSWSRNPELSSLLDSSRVSASQKCQQSQGSGGVVVAKPRTVVTFGLVSRLRVSKIVNSHKDWGGRGRETQNCRHFLDSSRVSASQKCQQSQGSGGSWSRNPELSSLLDSSRVSASQKGGFVVAKPRTVVTFGLVSRLRISKVSTVSGIGGGRGRETQNCRHFWRKPELSSLLDSSRVFASQKCQQSQGSGGFVVAKPRTVVTFGLVSRLRVSKVSTVSGIGGVVVAKPRTVVTFGLVSRLRVSKVSTVSGIGGVVVAKPRTVRVFASQKCQQSQGSGGSWSRNPELSSLLDLSRISASQKCQQSQGSGGGRGRETQNCRHFWSRLGSSRLKSVNSLRDRGGSWSRNPELSSLLDSPLERGKERGERRKERGDRREERRAERRERRGERIEEGRERGEEREVRR